MMYNKLKLAAMFALMIAATACRAEDDGKVDPFAKLESEIAQKQAELEQVKKAGGYPNVRLPAVCIGGIVYYVTTSYGGYRQYVVAISSTTAQPILCAKAGN